MGNMHNVMKDRHMFKMLPFVLHEWVIFSLDIISKLSLEKYKLGLFSLGLHYSNLYL